MVFAHNLDVGYLADRRIKGSPPPRSKAYFSLNTWVRGGIIDSSGECWEGRSMVERGTPGLCLDCDTFEMSSRRSSGATGSTDSEVRGEARAGDINLTIKIPGKF